jgi:mono/diheme cytochrome c family protein
MDPGVCGSDLDDRPLTRYQRWRTFRHKEPSMTTWLRRGRALVVALTVAPPIVLGAQTAIRSVWEGVYTTEQAERGRTVYEDQCAFCHLSDLRGQGFAPSLVEETFRLRWQDDNLGDLFVIVQGTMPQDKPASLTEQQYAEVVAYLLRANAFPAGPKELPADPMTLKTVMFQRPEVK